MAASFDGWYFATCSPERSPAMMIMIDVTMPKVAAMRNDRRNISSLRLFKSWMAEMPMMKNAVSVYAEAMTCQNLIQA